MSDPPQNKGSTQNESKRDTSCKWKLSTVQGANLCIRRREKPILLLDLDNLCPHQRRTTTHILVPVSLFLAMHQGDEGVTGMYRIWQSSTACLSDLEVN